MFEFLLFTLSAMVHSVPADPSQSATQQAQAQGEAVAVETAQTPLFLAPKEGSTEQAATTPVFLAPQGQVAETAETASATPVFLSPQGAAPQPQLQAEPQAPTGKFTTATEVKPILNLTRNNWIHVREFNGQDLVYVTHLWSWRCGLLDMKVGINGAAPEAWPLPQCHMDQPTPNAILETDGLPYRSFGLGAVSEVEVHLIYDDLSTEQVRFNRQGVALP
jgi:hypothetical protein